MKELTKAEEQVMQLLWDTERAFVKDLVEKFPEPRPAYNTVSTIIRILEKKGFVSHKSYGNTYEYYPLMSKDEYTRKFMKNFMKNYFSSSFKQMVSFFAHEEDMSIQELEELKKIMEQKIKEQKNGRN